MGSEFGSSHYAVSGLSALTRAEGAAQPKRETESPAKLEYESENGDETSIDGTCEHVDATSAKQGPEHAQWQHKPAL